MSHVVTLSHQGLSSAHKTSAVNEVWALVIAWSAKEPERVGELALLPPAQEAWVLGRDPVGASLGHSPPRAEVAGEQGRTEPIGAPACFFQYRPVGSGADPQPEGSPHRLKGDMLSRRQLLLCSKPDSLLVKNIGRCPALVNGRPLSEAFLEPGDTLHLQDQLLLLCVRRRRELQALRFYPAERLPAFGEVDLDGILGESPAIWKLRERIASYARTAHHVLIIGESGSGKELAAQALHRLSPRAARKLIADNAATIPPGLASALLFGNRRNFPNPGMEERIGLIGSAHGSTLFLDEIGDMPQEVQPMFLRVAERGEYTRLGDEGRVQHADFRLIGATNRPEHLRYELKRRFAREIRVPGLEQRKEDIPLLVRYLLLQLAAEGDLEAAGYLRGGQPLVSPHFIEALLHHRYQTHVSELKRLLVLAMAESHGELLTRSGMSLVTPRAAALDSAASRPAAREPAPLSAQLPSQLPSLETAQGCLDRLGGNIRQAAQELGISRDQLNRMVRKAGLRLNRRNKSHDDGEVHR